MANRKRPIRVRTYLTEEELKMVHKRMAQMGTTNREAYMRKMALDGYILRLEIPELKEYVAMQRVHSKRFNEIAKRVNETGRLYPEDVAEMKNAACCFFHLKICRRTADDVFKKERTCLCVKDTACPQRWMWTIS